MRRQHLTAALVFLILTLVLTNPLILHIWNSVEDKQDALLNTWIVAWVGHAFITDPLNLFNANIFYPYPNTLAFSEALVPQGLFALPFMLATNNTIFGYNLVLFVMLWFNAFAMYLFVYDGTKRSDAGWVAGAIYGFSAFNLGNFAQIQLLSLGWLPLALLFLGKLLYGDKTNRARWRDALLFTLFFILQALSSFYYALLVGLAIGLYLLWWLLRARATLLSARRRVLVPLAISFALIGLVLIPFLLPYLDVQRDLGFTRTKQESEPFSASLKQFTEVSPQNLLYGRFLAPNPVIRTGGYPLDNLFPGVIAIGLAAVGLVSYRRGRESGFFLLLLIVSFTLALGPRLYLTSRQATNIVLPYSWLYDAFPLMRALRAPVRFEALIMFAVAACAGFGASALLERMIRKRATPIALAIVGLIALEYLALPAANIAQLPVANEIPQIYKWLAVQPPTVVLQVPMMAPDANKELDISNQYFTTYDWQKTPDGYSGFIPPRRGEIAYEMESFPSPRSVALLGALGVRYVVDDSPRQECYLFSAPIGYRQLRVLSGWVNPCVYEVPTPADIKNELQKSLYVPSSVSAGQPFSAYLILSIHDSNAFAVEPTDHVQLQAIWNNGQKETASFPTPLVTSSATVVPIRLIAPKTTGAFVLALNANDSLIGPVDVSAPVNVTDQLASEVVLPATIDPRPLPSNVYTRGSTIAVPIRWQPLNKIDAYYSASVRLVDIQGNKVANVDRQPSTPTLLWRPDSIVEDNFQLPVPTDIAPGKYRVEVLMYQGNSGTDALLLDGNFQPQHEIVLGEVEIK